MSSQYRRQKPQGRHHRTKLRVLLVPTLRVGQPIPSAEWLGNWLHIAPSEAYRHMRRVLTEDGITTETRGTGYRRRIYVVSLQDWRDAA